MRVLLSIVLLGLCARLGLASDFDIGPDNMLFHFRGPTDVSDAGRHLQALGDINGDGFDDVAVSCLEDETKSTSLGAFIFFGGNPVDSVPDMLIRGDLVAEPIDFTGDGVPDLVTRERGRYENGFNFGKLLFYRGFADSIDSEPVDSLFYPESGFGFADKLATGYVNSDQLGDIVADYGETVLYYESPLTTDTVADWTWQIESHTHSIRSLSVLDFNGDGSLDIVLGLLPRITPDQRGLVKFFWGPDFGTQPDLVLEPPYIPDSLLDPAYYAYFSAPIGDYDADGYSDFLVVYSHYPVIYFGGPDPTDREPYLLDTRSVSAYLWHPVAGVGDLNDDGYEDMALMTNRYSEWGAVEFFLGGPEYDEMPDDKLVEYELPPYWQDQVGRTISSAGDMNGDGVDDFTFSATNFTGGEFGEVYVFGGDPGVPTGVDDDRPGIQMPTEFQLEQNYPNPFNSSTVIQFTLVESATVSLSVYNPLGQRVAQLIADQRLTIGTHTVSWNGTLADGKAAASGTYFYKLTVGDQCEVRKMVYLK